MCSSGPGGCGFPYVERAGYGKGWSSKEGGAAYTPPFYEGGWLCPPGQGPTLLAHVPGEPKRQWCRAEGLRLLGLPVAMVIWNLLMNFLRLKHTVSIHQFGMQRKRKNKEQFKRSPGRRQHWLSCDASGLKVRVPRCLATRSHTNSWAVFEVLRASSCFPSPLPRPAPQLTRQLDLTGAPIQRWTGAPCGTMPCAASNSLNALIPLLPKVFSTFPWQLGDQ